MYLWGTTTVISIQRHLFFSRVFLLSDVSVIVSGLILHGSYNSAVCANMTLHWPSNITSAVITQENEWSEACFSGEIPYYFPPRAEVSEQRGKTELLYVPETSLVMTPQPASFRWEDKAILLHYLDLHYPDTLAFFIPCTR